MFLIYADNLRHGAFKRGVLLLVAIQIVVFVIEQLTDRLSFAPEFPLTFIPVLFSIKPLVYSYTLITASFLHSSFLHLFGNLMFLLGFGRTLEKLFGTVIFVSAYIFIGALAYIGDWLLAPNSTVPIIGSSGAVAFLMGVYLMLFPNAKLRLLITIPPFFKKFLIPAYIFLLLWMGQQVYEILSTDGRSNVAFATHIFGFLIGVIGAMAWKELAENTKQQLDEFSETNK
jgi:membrane associated rhomboid family serine protease